ncbi:hypothetical protein [Oxynema aestuarii]|uniref:Uncharacterized protein n=1 Tax=Oxynema aestuarii AP17 TaxID=2064643 RepID=A0A6H1U3G1_9CYAN|nr:hypothetical protein [Oxynema aestuarii]QIZ72690.1 hypothetical protein HCG48_20560 [Oxynema aestuarii AP17]
MNRTAIASPSICFSLIGGKPRTLREAVGMKAEAIEWNGLANLVNLNWHGSNALDGQD